MIAQVYVNTKNLNIDKPFDYIIPKEFEGKVAVGVRVKVPFGGGNIPKEAFVTEIKDKSDFSSLKPIRRVTDEFPVLTKESIRLCFYMRERYFCTFFDAASLCFPPGTDAKFEEWISLSHAYFEKKELVKGVKQEMLIRLLEDSDGSAEMSQIKNVLGKNARSSVNSLIEKGLCEKSFRDKRRANEKTVRLAYYSGDEDISFHIEKLSRTAPKQSAVLGVLAEHGKLSVPDIISAASTTRNAVESLYIKGLIDYCEVEVLRNPLADKKRLDVAPLSLSDSQRAVADAIIKKGQGTFLIHGVTGSGKTEVYMQIATEAIRDGKQVILLVPEIALTPQMTSRFYNRFGGQLAIIHSALSLGERLDEWHRIKRGEASIIIGARSAIFAPCEKLGAIIIDEEHEQSYKSESSPRYHARDIAHFLAKRHGCPLVLGSATPSVESYHKAKSNEYTLLELSERFNKKPLPEVFIADMRKELREGNKTVLSRLLASEIHENISKKEQTILFLNRRGYSTFVSCRDCGYVFTCPECNVSLTYHKSNNTLTCHYCGYQENIRYTCPVCESTRVKDFGKGTQKAQEQIEKIFEGASLIRMDADTTSGKRGHEKIIDKFEAEKTDILLGTQMVTKGLDFENVTLVGVLAADASLNVDDFRAQERTFNLITQVCGRAGRGEIKGRCVIQTYAPENPTLLLAAKQDYKAFFEEEIQFREEFLYPPFCDIINITVTSSRKEEAEAEAQKIAQELRVSLRAFDGWSLFGPSPAPLGRLQGRWRERIWLKCNADDEFIKTIRACIYEKSKRGKEDLSVVTDINPYNMS